MSYAKFLVGWIVLWLVFIAFLVGEYLADRMCDGVC
jgi:hypothetical protein